jgi:hypothetical protein
MNLTKKYIVRVKTLDKVAKEINPLFRVLYHKKDGWWLETENKEHFLGCDSYGAFTKLIKQDFI